VRCGWLVLTKGFWSIHDGGVYWQEMIISGTAWYLSIQIMFCFLFLLSKAYPELLSDFLDSLIAQGSFREHHNLIVNANILKESVSH